jgi:hypothetical protein
MILDNYCNTQPSKISIIDHKVVQGIWNLNEAETQL